METGIDASDLPAAVAQMALQLTEVNNDQISTASVSQTEKSPIRLAGLPNETLLKIFANVPFKASGESVINLRLVNRQLRDLLTDEPSLKQFRNDVGREQFPLAALLREPVDQTWESLRELDEENITIADFAKQVLGDNNSTDAEGNGEREIVTMGLYLYAAIARLPIKISSETEAAVILRVLGEPCVGLLRMTSIAVSRWLMKLYRMNSEWDTFFGLPCIILAIENMLARDGLSSFVAMGSPGTSWFLVDTLSPDIDDVDFPVSFSTSVMAFMMRNSSPNSRYMREAKRVKMTGVRPRWGVVANDILILGVWKRLKEPLSLFVVEQAAFDGEPCNLTVPEGYILREIDASADFIKYDWF